MKLQSIKTSRDVKVEHFAILTDKLDKDSTILLIIVIVVQCRAARLNILGTFIYSAWL